MISRRSVRLLVGGLLAILLLALFFRGVDLPALLAAFSSAEPIDLGLVILFTLATYALRAWRWGYLLAPLADIPFRRLFSATVVGFMTGLVVPRAGEVVRPYLVGRRHGIKTSAAFASIILERLVDLITVLVLFGLYLYVLPLPAAQTRGPLLGMLKAVGGLTGLGALAVLAVLVAFHVNAERATALTDRFLSRFPRGLAAPLGQMVRSFAEGLAVIQAPAGHLLAIMGLSLLVWLTIATTFFFNNHAFGLDLPFRASFLLIGFLTVGVAVPTPGMVGGFHEAYLLALTEAFGIDKGKAAAAGIAGHALTNLPVLVLGLIFLGGEGLTFGKVAEMTEETPEPEAGSNVVGAPAAAAALEGGTPRFKQ